MTRSTARRLSLLVAALAATLAFASPAAFASPLSSFALPPGCTVSWDGSAGTTRWHDAANWDTDVLPGPADRVCIAAAAPGGAVVLGDPVATTVAALYSEKPLNVSAGHLLLAGASTVDVLRLTGGVVEAAELTVPTELVQVGGELTGGGTVAVQGLMVWTAGTQSGSGVTDLLGPGGLLLDGDGTRTIRGQRLVSSATDVTWTGEGSVVLEGGHIQALKRFVSTGPFASVIGNGVVHVTEELVVNGALDLRVALDGASATAVVDGANAQLALRAGGDQFVDFDLRNGGSVFLDGPAHTLFGDVQGTSGGGIVANADVTVEGAYAVGATTVNTGTLTLPAGARLGRARVRGGAIELRGEAAAETVEQSGGDLRGTATLGVDGSFTWSGGAQSGTGVTEVRAGELALAGEGVRTLRGDRLLTAPGVAWTGGGSVSFENGTLQSTGPFVANGAAAQLSGAGTLMLGDELLVDGTYLGVGVDLQAGSASIRVRGERGRLALSAGEHIANFRLEQDGSLLALTGAHRFVGPITGGSGALIVDGGDVTLERELVVDRISMIDGKLKLPAETTVRKLSLWDGVVETSAAATLAELQQEAGELRGAGALTVTGTFSWLGGIQSGSGETVVGGAAGTLELLGAGTRTLDRVLRIQRQARLGRGATLSTVEGAALVVAGDLLADDGPAFVDGDGSVLVDGSVRVRGVELGLAAELKLRPGSSLEVSGTNGLLSLAGDGFYEGGVTVDTGGHLELIGGTHTFDVESDLDAMAGGYVSTDEQAELYVRGVFDAEELWTLGAKTVIDAPTVNVTRLLTHNELDIQPGSALVTHESFENLEGTVTLRGAVLEGRGTIENGQTGTIQGLGTVRGRVLNKGTLRPGLPGESGVLRVDGAVELTPDSTVSIQASAAAHDLLIVDGTAILDGALALTLADDVDELTVVRPFARIGEFATVTGSGCAAVRYESSHVIATNLPCLDVGNAQASESDGSLRFPVSVSRSSGQTVSVRWEAVDGTATAGEDYPGANGILILADGQTSSAITLPVIDDGDEEAAQETLTLQLTGAEGARLRTQQVTGTIIDDDGANAPREIWYKPRNIGSVGMRMHPTAINYRSIVGYTENAVDEIYWKWAFGYRVDLDQLSTLGTLGAAWDLNASGTIAANTDVSDDSDWRPVLRRNVTGIAELPPVPGYTSAYALGLNDAEWVTGEASRPSGGTDAILWKPDGSTVVLDSPSTDTGFSVGYDVNNKGQAIGSSARDGGRAGWIWEDGAIRDLGQLGTVTTPRRLNEHGEVVGVSGTGQIGHAFVWRESSGMVDLGVGWASDINEKHEIVGGSANGPVIWRSDGTKHSLNSMLPANSGWVLSTADAINDDGLITGVGYLNGSRAVYVLKPLDCKVCVEELKTEELVYSTASYVESDKATDGNKIKITAKVVNEALVAKDVVVKVVDAQTGEQLGEDVDGFALDPGQSHEISTVWDTAGSAWKDGAARRTRTVKIELSTPDEEPLDDHQKELKILPRPVVMVHGLWSDASTWEAYPELMKQVNPDWYGFPVATMDTSSAIPNTVQENAAELAQAIENVRVAREAWHVDLVGHSMGGLISRRYISQLMPQLPDGSAPVENLVMLGTPNWGSPCAWLAAVPATFELRPEIVAASSGELDDRRGVKYSVAAGEHMPVTCGAPLPGDDVVPIISAQTGVQDTALFQIAHTDMTHSALLFNEFVRPRLATAPEAPLAARGFAASSFAAQAITPPDLGERPQLLDLQLLTLAPGQQETVVLDGSDGSAVGAVLAAPGTVRAVLLDALDAEVAVIEPDGKPGLAFRTLRAPTEFGEFRLVLENQGAEEVQFPVSAWVEQPQVKLEANAIQSSPSGRVRVTAQLVGAPGTPSISATITRPGGQPVNLVLRDDGLSGDGAKGDRVFSNRTSPLPEGDHTVVVRAEGSVTRVATLGVRVVVPETLPPNTPPVPTTAPVEVKANGTVTFTLSATDADDDDLEVVRFGNPTNGLLTGSGRTYTYTPRADYVGTDSFTYRVSDGITEPVLGTVAISVTKRTSLFAYQGVDEVREGTTLHLVGKLVDAQLTGRVIEAQPVTFELDGVQVPVSNGSFGIYSAEVPIPAGLKTMELVVRFPGNALYLPTEERVLIIVRENRAPTVVGNTAVITGEAGYTTRFYASPRDPDSNLTTIEWDYTNDGVYDASYALDDPTAEWITVYPEAFEGKARVRVTDRLGLQATATIEMRIAPHRPLGPLSRILVDGRRVDGGATSEDGRFMLFDRERNDIPPTGRPDELFVLDRETGQDERVGILPGGGIARDYSRLVGSAQINATGRWVAFVIHNEPIGDPGEPGQVYLRDRDTDTTEIVSLTSSEQKANGGSSPVAISPDGRYVLMQSRATNLDPRTTLACPGCENLFLRDREAGTTELVSLGYDGKPVGNHYLTGGMSADARYVVFESAWKAVPEKTSTKRDIFVRDLELDRTVRVNVPAGGGEADRDSVVGYIGDRGRYVIFMSDATNLVPGDTNGWSDVFRHDRDADGDGIYDEPGATSITRVSVGTGGTQSNHYAAFAKTNCDGSVVTFWSSATNLVPGDTNAHADTFVHDVRTGTTTRISVEPRDGIEGDAESTWAEAISPDGRFVYFPSDASNLVPGDVNGARDHFVYDRGTSVNCWQGGGNEAPVAVEDTFEVEEDEELVFPAPGVLANDTDADGDLLEAEVVEAPEHGVLLLLEDGSLAYTPEPDFNGEDEFTYVATDGTDDSQPATVTLEVTPVNDAPVAEDSLLSTDEDVPVELAFAGSDPDDLPESEEPTTLEPQILSGPQHGTIADGVYAPEADWSGTDTVEFRLSDGTLESEAATLTIVVAPANDAPVATDGTAATDEDTAVELTFAGTDIDGDELTYELVEQPAHGSVSGRTYTPAANWNGVETVRFRASDGSLADEAIVTVTVVPANDGPEAADASVATDEDTAVELVLAGTDVDGDTLSFELVEEPAYGSVSGRIYTPAADWNGVETLRFRAFDGSLSDEGVLTVTVRPGNDAPTAIDGEAATDEDTAVQLPFAGTDIDGDELAYEVVDRPEHGTVAGLTYTPDANWNGVDTVRFRASDGTESDQGVVIVTVRPVNDAPTVTIASAGPVDEGAAAIPVTATATDVDGDAVTYAWSAEAGVVDGAGATATFRADDGPAAARVRVIVSDGEASGNGETTIEVRNVAPRVVAGPAVVGPWGIALELGGTASDPSVADRASLGATWAFGDETSGTGLPTTHAYAAAGSYLAMVTVSDKDGGAATAEAPVTVRKRPTAVEVAVEAASTPEEAFFAVRLSDSVDAPSARLAGREVVVEVAGQTLRGVVDAAGTATVRPATPLAPGMYSVMARFAEDALYLASETSARVVVGATPGKVTGGGLSTADGGRGGFTVQSDGLVVTGELEWQAGEVNLHAHELSALAISSDRRRARFEGLATDGRRFTVEVEDNGKDDRFRLWLEGVLLTPEPALEGGNIQIHKG